jgi:hypothetical protein
LVDQSFHDFRVDISAEGFSDPLILAQLLNHAIERGRQLADLVPRRDIDRSIEAARFDSAGALEQPPHWTGYAVADEDRENQSEYRSERRNNCRH